MDEARLQDTVDEVAIRRLLSCYADVANRRAWPELEDLFTSDAVVEVDKRSGDPLRLPGAKAVGDFIGSSIERFEFFEFVLLNVRTELRVGGDPDAAAARVFIWELRHDADNGRWTNAYGVYHDQYRRDGGPIGWRFSGRRYHSLARTARDADVFPFPAHLAPGGGMAFG